MKSKASNIPEVPSWRIRLSVYMQKAGEAHSLAWIPHSIRMAGLLAEAYDEEKKS